MPLPAGTVARHVRAHFWYSPRGLPKPACHHQGFKWFHLAKDVSPRRWPVRTSIFTKVRAGFSNLSAASKTLCNSAMKRTRSLLKSEGTDASGMLRAGFTSINRFSRAQRKNRCKYARSSRADANCFLPSKASIALITSRSVINPSALPFHSAVGAPVNAQTYPWIVRSRRGRLLPRAYSLRKRSEILLNSWALPRSLLACDA